MKLGLLLLIATTQAEMSRPPDFNQLDTFLTVTRTPSGLVLQTEVRIGTFQEERFGPERRPTNYWFDRSVRDLNRTEQPVERSYANTDACPDARQVLLAVESVAMPHPDAPDYGNEPRLSSVDGVHYTLEGTSLHADGQNGQFKIESNRRSPAAHWVDRLLSALERCWRPSD